MGLSCKPNIYVSPSTSELRVRLAPWNRFKPSSKIFYFFCGSFTFFLSCVCYAFVRVSLYVPCGHLLGKGWPLGSRLWCLTVVLSLFHWWFTVWYIVQCTLVSVTLVFRTFYPLSPFYRFILVHWQISSGTLRNNEGTWRLSGDIMVGRVWKLWPRRPTAL